ncbi:MAG: Gfo/Idh/MocA family protein [Actinomycetales bacterium]
MADTMRWGILSTGRIAASFVRALHLVDDATVTAVGSRSAEGAARFLAEHADVLPPGVHGHGSYDDLVADPDVDVVYVATPHPLHAQEALRALRAGKHVLLEKPFTLNAVEAQQVVDEARSRGLFLMEAMWTRFLPHIVRVRELLANGAVGDLVCLTADHGQWFAPDPDHRIFAPELGGGALLDLGIYPVSFASLVLGDPTRVRAVATPAFTGVDGTTSVVLEHDGGAQAVLTTTSLAATANVAVISGTEGRIEVDRTWYRPTTFRLVSRDGEVLEEWQRVDEHGLRFQAMEVAACIRAGRTESDVMSLDETVRIMQTLDEVRRQIGLTYPGETSPGQPA